MIELPEAVTLANQMNAAVKGKIIKRVTAAQTPHKFAWYYGDPQKYEALLTGKTIGNAAGCGAMVEIKADGAVLLFTDGVNLRLHTPHQPRPSKHQLLIDFTDGTALSASVQMYGGLWCFPEGKLENRYYQLAKTKPSPLSADFSATYFTQILNAPDVPALSAKAFLATGQRIPGLGNGVLQDILFNAKIHPKRKIKSLADTEKQALYSVIKTTLKAMADSNGRDTEKDLYGNPGGYKTLLSKNTAGTPCPVCGKIIKKEAYLGGSVYYCPGCQPL